MVCMLVVQIQLEVGCVACTTVNIDCPYPSQMPLVVWISFVPHGQSLSCALLPSSCCVAALEGRQGPCRLSVSGCRFWWTRAISDALPLQAPVMTAPSLLRCHFWAAVSHVWVLSLVLVALLQVLNLWFEVSSLTLPKLGHVLEWSWETSHETCVVPVLHLTIFPFSNPRTVALSVWLVPLIPHGGSLSL